MKRSLVAILLFILVGVYAFAQSPTQRTTVGLWVAVNDSTYRTRFINEIVPSLNNNPDWNFTVIENEWDTDVHVIVSGMPVVGADAYAWSITVTPIFAPYWTNGTAATSAANIGGMNWMARTTVDYIVNQLYAWYDTVLDQQNNEL